MLKRFLLNILSSFVGTWLAIVLSIVSIVIVAIAVAVNFKDSNDTATLTGNSVLVINLDGVIAEKETATKPDVSQLIAAQGIEKPQSLSVILKSIQESVTNDNVKGIYLKCGAPQAGAATLNSIRKSLVNFRKSGKKIVAYGDQYSLGSYFVASAANKVILNPYGSIAIQGMGGSTLFFKGLFDKLGVEFQVVKVGSFKSAVEPYISTSMSEPARAQLDTLYGSMWWYIRDQIKNYRPSLTPEKMDSLVNDGLTFASAESTLKNKLVDQLAYERVVDDIVAKEMGLDSKNLNYVDPHVVIGDKFSFGSISSKNNIAVLYATGEIIDGGNSGINYETIVPIITELADDESVKGLVLRVNSPGGSAFGSDQIGEALDYFKSKKKPFAVSMGDYAASGGYWISCSADRIYADPLTVTGSIGIFGLIPNFKGLMGKVGVNSELVSTNPGAAFPNTFEPMSPRQLSIMQNYVNAGYERFINRVAKGRGMSIDRVKQIAEGRVWGAMAAKRIGLVDALGDLDAAVLWVAEQCKVADNYSVSVYPTFEPSIWDMIPSIDITASAQLLPVDGEIIKMREKLFIDIMSRNKVWARMPEFNIELCE